MTPAFLDAENAMIAHDGARLGLTVWKNEGVEPLRQVIVGIHGMNNYAGEFRLAAPEWAAQGRVVYAYDQRGFGRSVNRGHWAGEELMREDLRTAVGLARDRHPEAVVSVVAISMGAAVAITAFASDRPPAADRLILSGPGLVGWGALNPAYGGALKLMMALGPGLKVSPPAFLKPKLSDNGAFLALQDADPLHSRTNRIDQLHGAISLMENAHSVVGRLPPTVAVLAAYGAHDRVVPPAGPRRTLKQFPAHVRTVYYPQGYHVLLSDNQRDRVVADYSAFMDAPAASLPSGLGPWPFG
ncbi:lysophospholipase [Hyphomonas sp. WL0036]|uniref:alpha/beta fold hydrolase n=1 Tax=Hyphomonas sediminis TaxID=2866160 RepID=UPI001C7F6103|nr:alpha/beta fold hydrolase [Hyphomonas sediminis]MBY9067902.1 lysophospholipase [Hyphomonas sediminis]